MIDVIAFIQVKPGRLEEFLAIFNANCPAVLAEDGCHGYYPAVDIASGHPAQQQDPNRVTVVEKWRDVDALRAHSASPHMKAYGVRVKDMVDGVSLRVVQQA